MDPMAASHKSFEPQEPDSPDRQKLAAFRRMRALATGLLLLMFALFLLAHRFEHLHPAVSFLRAFAEAGMVGAVADWFAVTALFRHPLRLPIPHTAIIPRNKDRIGGSIGRFVAENFLNEQVVVPKLRGVDPAGHLACWLADPDNARFAARRVARGLPLVINAMNDEPVRRLLKETAARRLQAVEAGPLLGRVLAVLVAGGQHMVLFDRMLDAAARFLYANDQVIREKIADNSKWWVPDFVDRKLADKIVAGVEGTLSEMRDPEHPWRGEFNRAVGEALHNLVFSPETRARAEAIKQDMLGHPAVQAYLEGLWTESKALLLHDLADRQGGRIEEGLAQALQGLGERMIADASLRATVNGWMEKAVLRVFIPNRHRIGAFMEGVVKSWDTDTLVAKLELQVGKDLQYIRINGTLVGGMVGVLLHALVLAGGAF